VLSDYFTIRNELFIQKKAPAKAVHYRRSSGSNPYASFVRSHVRSLSRRLAWRSDFDRPNTISGSGDPQSKPRSCIKHQPMILLPCSPSRRLLSWVPFTVKNRCAAPDCPLPLELSLDVVPPRAVPVVVRVVTPLLVEPISAAVLPSCRSCDVFNRAPSNAILIA
jgi:hypothetical protein